MAVKVGSARIDENGNAYGGKAGDQTGSEVGTQNWYLHKKGWRVFRCKDPAKADKMARAMEAACKNSKIGYDQYQRNTLYTQAEKVGFDVSKVTTACETDCSALVRVCCAYAGIMGLPSDFRTGNMPANLLATKMFVEMMGSKYQIQSVYLRRGDILVTKTSGHTVIVLTDGPKAEKDVPPASAAPATTAGTPVTLGSRILKKGMAGSDVREMQAELMAQDYKLPKYGADGDFGGETLAAVKAFQADKGLTVDGEFGPKSLAALQAGKPAAGKVVVVTGSAVNVRSAPNTGARILGVAHRGDRLEYQGETSGDWLLVVYRGENAWISGKFSEVE